MNQLPPDLLDEITRYAAELIEQRAVAQAKENFDRTKLAEGQVRDKGPNLKRTTRRQQAKALILEGLSDSEVEDRTGYCPAMVQRLRVSMGIYKSRALTQEALFAIAFSLMNTLKPYHEIARDHGVHASAVKAIAKKMKDAGLVVPFRKPGRPKGIG